MTPLKPWTPALLLVWLSGSVMAVNIATVPVGDPGNPGRLSGAGAGGYGPDAVCGSVGYTYNIGTYEVTAGQYCEFLNAVAKTDTFQLWSPAMQDNSASAHGCMIVRSGTPGSYTYSVAADRAGRPVNYVSWADAARFVNWLHNGQPTGNQDLGTTEDGAYFLNGATTDAQLASATRQDNGRWAIASEDEWYKAAYHKNDGTTGNYFDYPTRSNVPPGQDMTDLSGNNANYYTAPYAWPIDSGKYATLAGEFQNSASPYGTFDQGGNVWEWNDTVIGTLHRGVRGGSFVSLANRLHASYRDRMLPSSQHHDLGFRVVALPEPATATMFILAGAAGVLRRRGGSSRR